MTNIFSSLTWRDRRRHGIENVETEAKIYIFCIDSFGVVFLSSFVRKLFHRFAFLVRNFSMRHVSNSTSTAVGFASFVKFSTFLLHSLIRSVSSSLLALSLRRIHCWNRLNYFPKFLLLCTADQFQFFCHLILCRVFDLRKSNRLKTKIVFFWSQHDWMRARHDTTHTPQNDEIEKYRNFRCYFVLVVIKNGNQNDRDTARVMNNSMRRKKKYLIIYKIIGVTNGETFFLISLLELKRKFRWPKIKEKTFVKKFEA